MLCRTLSWQIPSTSALIKVLPTKMPRGSSTRASNSEGCDGRSSSVTHSQPEQKVTRTGLACLTCRESKVRCEPDGDTCKRCTTRNVPCLFVRKMSAASQRMRRENQLGQDEGQGQALQSWSTVGSGTASPQQPGSIDFTDDGHPGSADQGLQEQESSQPVSASVPGGDGRYGQSTVSQAPFAQDSSIPGASSASQTRAPFLGVRPWPWEDDPHRYPPL